MLPDYGRSISRKVTSLSILVHDVINLLYYGHWTDKRKYFSVYKIKDEIIQNDINREAAKISEAGKIDKNEYLTGEEISPSD